jgi:hypothetical protein
MATALVQAATAALGSVGTTSIAQAFGSNVQFDTLLLALTSWASTTGQTASCADTRTNTYTGLTERRDTGNQQSSQTFWTPSVSGGANTATITFSAAASFRQLGVSEFSDVDTTGTHAANGVASQAATTTPTTGQIITSARCLIVSHIGLTDAQSVTSVPSGFTSLNAPGAGGVLASAYAVLDAGTYNPQWTTASGRYNGDTTAFVEGAPGGPGGYEFIQILSPVVVYPS